MSLRSTKSPLTEQEITDLWALFGPPPLLSTEKPESYERIRAEYVAFYRPTNGLQVRAIREAVDGDWEIFRMGRHRSICVDRQFQKHRDAHVAQLRTINQDRKARTAKLPEHSPREIALVAELKLAIDQADKNIEALAKTVPDEIAYNRALEQGADFLDHLDRWQNSATARRNNALQLLEYSMTRVDNTPEIIATEYKEITNANDQHVTSPALVPAVQEVTHDVDAQDDGQLGEQPKE